MKIDATVIITSNKFNSEDMTLHLQYQKEGVRLRKGDAVTLTHKDRGTIRGTFSSVDCQCVDIPASEDNRLAVGDRVTLESACCGEALFIRLTPAELTARLEAARAEVPEGFDAVKITEVCRQAKDMTGHWPVLTAGSNGNWWCGYRVGTPGYDWFTKHTVSPASIAPTPLAAAQSLLAAVTPAAPDEPAPETTCEMTCDGCGCSLGVIAHRACPYCHKHYCRDCAKAVMFDAITCNDCHARHQQKAQERRQKPVAEVAPDPCPHEAAKWEGTLWVVRSPKLLGGVHGHKPGEPCVFCEEPMPPKPTAAMSIEECVEECPDWWYADCDSYGWRVYDRRADKLRGLPMAVLLFPNYSPTCLEAWQAATSKFRDSEKNRQFWYDQARALIENMKPITDMFPEKDAEYLRQKRIAGESIRAGVQEFVRQFNAQEIATSDEPNRTQDFDAMTDDQMRAWLDERGRLGESGYLPPTSCCATLYHTSSASIVCYVQKQPDRTTALRALCEKVAALEAENTDA